MQIMMNTIEIDSFAISPNTNTSEEIEIRICVIEWCRSSLTASVSLV